MWRPVTDFELNEQEMIELNMYIGALQLSMISLRMEEDVLIGMGPHVGSTLPKKGISS